jgi:hypothetical protein
VQILGDGCERGWAGFAGDGAGQQAIRFFDDKDVGVFVNDWEGEAGFWRFTWCGNCDDILGLDRLREFGRGNFVDENAAVLNHALEGLALGGGEIISETIEEDHSIGTDLSRK